MSYNFFVHPNIAKAETLPASFYRDNSIFEDIKHRVFFKSWQWIGDKTLVSKKHATYPFILLEDYLSERVKMNAF